MALAKKLKYFLKAIVYQNDLLRNIFIFSYQCGGRKPWSLGYSQYKFKFIRDTILERLELFKESQLPSGFGFGLDERVVEYPWIFSRLKPEHKVILDAGSSLNQTDILNLAFWRGRQLSISTLDYEGCFKGTITPSYFYEDIRHSSFKDETFDAIICLSTLEHVGLDNTFLYTKDQSKKEESADGYLAAVRELKRTLKKGGSLFLTMPFGKYQNHGWFQIFDAGMVEKVKDCFAASASQETYFRYAGKQWQLADQKECSNGYFFDIHKTKELQSDYLAASQSVVCLELVK